MLHLPFLCSLHRNEATFVSRRGRYHSLAESERVACGAASIHEGRGETNPSNVNQMRDYKAHKDRPITTKYLFSWAVLFARAAFTVVPLKGQQH